MTGERQNETQESEHSTRLYWTNLFFPPTKLTDWLFPTSPSLCTMLSLQWEPEIIAVAVMYLAGRLCKFDIQEWTIKQTSRRWWEQFVQDVPVELLEGKRKSLHVSLARMKPAIEHQHVIQMCLYFQTRDLNFSLCLSDICHQILDLYSQGNKPIPQQIQEKERPPVPPLPAPPAPQGQPPAANPPPPPPKKTPPQGSSPARPLKRSHVSTGLDETLSWAVDVHWPIMQHMVQKCNLVYSFDFPLFQTSPKEEPKAPGKSSVKLYASTFCWLRFDAVSTH